MNGSVLDLKTKNYVNFALRKRILKVREAWKKKQSEEKSNDNDNVADARKQNK